MPMHPKYAAEVICYCHLPVFLPSAMHMRQLITTTLVLCEKFIMRIDRGEK